MASPLDAPLQPPTGSVLVRLPILGPDALATLPAVPAPHQVTISLGDPALRALVAPGTLEALGYQLVGAHDVDGLLLPEALVLVRAVLVTAHTAWMKRLLARADKAWDLDLGPARMIMRSRIERHLAFAAAA